MTELQTKVHAYFAEHGFLPVTAETYPILKSYETKGNRIFECTASNIIQWVHDFNVLYKVLHNYMCAVSFYGNGEVRIAVQKPESGAEPLKHVIDTLHSLAFNAGLPALTVYPVDERFIGEYENIQGYCITKEYTDDWSEYIYAIEDFINESGGVNKNKRESLSRCRRVPDLSFKPLTKEAAQTCLSIEEEWCKGEDCEYCSSFSGCEKKSLQMLFELFDDGCAGLLLCEKEKPLGFVIWEHVPCTDFAFFYFGKSLVPNLSILLYHTAVSTALHDVKYINVGPDLGKSGLRFFKKHLGKHELVRKYSVNYKSTSAHNGEAD
ncbi:MAG: hypothetical protein Ta2F_04880 [Termitinemataceae bacterium]|nr:MAG: hypothetical protein Ta2F_04880 [Termitinemataceae bacterium]